MNLFLLNTLVVLVASSDNITTRHEVINDGGLTSDSDEDRDDSATTLMNTPSTDRGSFLCSRRNKKQAVKIGAGLSLLALASSIGAISYIRSADNPTANMMSHGGAVSGFLDQTNDFSGGEDLQSDLTDTNIESSNNILGKFEMSGADRIHKDDEQRDEGPSKKRDGDVGSLDTGAITSVNLDALQQKSLSLCLLCRQEIVRQQTIIKQQNNVGRGGYVGKIVYNSNSDHEQQAKAAWLAEGTENGYIPNSQHRLKLNNDRDLQVMKTWAAKGTRHGWVKSVLGDPKQMKQELERERLRHTAASAAWFLPGGSIIGPILERR